jgi:hypothetical protein
LNVTSPVEDSVTKDQDLCDGKKTTLKQQLKNVLLVVTVEKARIMV